MLDCIGRQLHCRGVLLNFSILCKISFSALRRSNSVDNASQSSTLKSHQEFNLSGADSDFDVEDESRPWSARFPAVSSAGPHMWLSVCQ